MRAITYGLLIVGASLSASTAAFAQNSGPAGPAEALPPPAPAGGGASAAGPAAAAPAEAAQGLPPPQAASPGGGDSGSPGGPATPAADEWKFSWKGYFRAPLRVGIGSIPGCPGTDAAGTAQGTALTAGRGLPCAASNQSTTQLHSPYVPDDQYLAWTFDRQWEQAWAEVFLSFGNSHVIGTVGLQAFDFTDASLLGNQANPAQFGIGQGWVTMTPDMPIEGLRLNWKIGAFWEKFGQAGKYDAGPYDTYIIGRTHQIGEALAAEYDLGGGFTVKAEHGIGAHLEMVPAGTAINPSGAGVAPPSNSPVIGQTSGFTMLDHFHAGISYKRLLNLNVHYMVAWTQDARETGDAAGTGSFPSTADAPGAPNGSIKVAGIEARIETGNFGELYVAYSHIDTTNVTAVGPAIEVVHSSGGGGHSGANGIYDNFYNDSGNGDGSIDSIEGAYTFDFQRLLGANVKLGLFGMLSAVKADATSVVAASTNALITGSGQTVPTDGTKKVKYGADLTYFPVQWLGIGARGDYLQPDSKNTDLSFGVLSPKIMLRSKAVTHEEVTIQYSHYFYSQVGENVIPGQQFVAATGPQNNAPVATPATNFMGQSVYKQNFLDKDVVGIKCTMWW